MRFLFAKTFSVVIMYIDIRYEVRLGKKRNQVLITNTNFLKVRITLWNQAMDYVMRQIFLDRNTNSEGYAYIQFNIAQSGN